VTDPKTGAITWCYNNWGGGTVWEGDNLTVTATSGYVIQQPALTFAHELTHNWQTKELGVTSKEEAEKRADPIDTAIRKEWRNRNGAFTVLWSNGTTKKDVPVPMLPSEKRQYGCK
jgi:hypothetical protein